MKYNVLFVYQDGWEQTHVISVEAENPIDAIIFSIKTGKHYGPHQELLPLAAKIRVYDETEHDSRKCLRDEIYRMVANNSLYERFLVFVRVGQSIQDPASWKPATFGCVYI